MRQWLLIPALLAGLLALAACAGEEKQATPAPAASPGGGRAAWEEEWGRVLAAAKREGTVAVMGPAGDEPRRALEPFEKKYGIKVEYLGGRGPEFTERVNTERAAGQYLWDVAAGGLTHWLSVMDEVLDPIEQALILPEVKDPKNWWGGGLQWLDDKRRILAMSFQTSNPIFVNTNLVKPQEIKSFKDLLDPKWKGKILSDDPRIAGASQSQYTFFYVHPELGPDFIRALFKQDLAMNRDRRQQLEWLAMGRYPILIGGSRQTAVPLIKEGLPIMNLDPRGIKEGAAMTAGNGHLFLFNRAPHPNAAKVFINWILTKEGQPGYMRANGIPSLRLDVVNDFVEPWELPQEAYIRMIGPEDHKAREKVAEFLVGLLGR